MKLLTKAIRKKLPGLYGQEGKGDDAIVHIKFFTPDAQWTWYILEGNPEYNTIKDWPMWQQVDDDDIIDFHFFGLVDGLEVELGYFNLSDLEKVRGKFGLPIERDMYWKPKTLGEVQKMLEKRQATSLITPPAWVRTCVGGQRKQAS